LRGLLFFAKNGCKNGVFAGYLLGGYFSCKKYFHGFDPQNAIFSPFIMESKKIFDLDRHLLPLFCPFK